jgi:hypothetical protein
LTLEWVREDGLAGGKTAFHLKNQVLTAFLDMTGAYENVLIRHLVPET